MGERDILWFSCQVQIRENTLVPCNIIISGKVVST